MGNTKKRTQTRQQKKKSSGWLPVAAAVVLVAAVAVTAFMKTGDSGEKGAGGSASAGSQTISEGGSLVIPVSEVSTTARFYPVEVDGTEMEIIAVEDSEGNIRTAFNTCQICYSSGRGYYVQDGDALVCQNCKNRFTVDQVEIESGGCNPWPIFPENKTVTDEFISISYEYLHEATRIFANWKAYS